MDEARSLSVLELPNFESQTICQVCRSSPAVFRYELFPDAATGSCCLSCFATLLRTEVAMKPEPDRTLKT